MRKEIKIFPLIFLVSILSSFMFTENSYGQSKNRSLSSTEDKIEQISYLKKCIIEKKCSINQEEAFPLLILEWKERDGASGYEISNSFLEILVFDPEFFFSAMLQNENDFYGWLAELEDLSFVWFKESPSPLKNKRKKLILLLEELGDLRTDADRLRISLLKKMREIKPRQID